MSLINKIKTTGRVAAHVAAAGGLIAGIVLGETMVLNYHFNNDVNYETKNEIIMRKTDGLFGATKVSVNKSDGGISVTTDYKNLRSYSDSNNDGLVDSLTMSYGHALSKDQHIDNFYRAKDLDDFSQLFENADSDLLKQKERFGIGDYN